MRRPLRLLAAAAMAVGGVSLAAPLAHAEGPHPVVSLCNSGWYSNPDEGSLLPAQVETGLLFDGPSLVHRALAAPVPLAEAPLNGAFTADVQVGAAPLFKMETAEPYSTINKTAAGTYWSSKIATGPGSQGAPVATIGDLVGLGPYLETTTVVTFGVGYANDAGNRAVVKTVTFGGSTWDLKCLPAPSSSSSAPSTSATPTPTRTPPSSPPATTPPPSATVPPATVTPSASSSLALAPPDPGTPGPGGRLPLTGLAGWTVAGSGVALLALGAGMLLFLRRRRVEFTAE